MPDPQYIRNFSIIAHIDHGKTTLSDRLLQKTGAVEGRDMHEQMLDENNLDGRSVINKVDLPSAEPERVREQIENVIGLDAHDAVLASAKSGIGVDEILEKIVTNIAAPKGDADGPLRALLFDSWYDSYR